MRKTSTSILALGCLFLAGLALAKGPRTPVTVTTNSTVALATIDLRICDTDASTCTVLDPNCTVLAGPNESSKSFCSLGFKAVSFRGNITIVDDGIYPTLCPIPATDLDVEKTFACSSEHGSGAVTIKVGNGN